MRCGRAAMQVACFVFGAGAVGCGTGSYYSLHTELITEAADSGSRTVQVSPAYAAVAAQVDTVAIRPDAQCADFAAGRFEGLEEASWTLMHIRCGVTMAALERAFAANGYRVVYWSAVERMAGERMSALQQQRRERLAARGAGQNVDNTVDDSDTPMGTLLPETVALEMGVDALVSVNSAEFLHTFTTPDARWRREYYSADSAGTELGRVNAPARLADAMDAFLEANERGIVEERVPTVALDVSVQFLRSEESIFFYRRTRSAGLSEATSYRYFVNCGHAGLSASSPYRCASQSPQSTDSTSRPSRNGSEEVVKLERDTPDLQMRSWTELLQEMVDDMAARFRSGPPPRAAAPLASPSAPASTAAPASAPSATPTPPGATTPPSDAAPAWLRTN